MPPRIAPGAAQRGIRGAPRGAAPATRGGASGGRGGSVAGGGPAIGAHVTTVGVRRPDYGTSGRPMQVFVNSFVANIPDGIIYHYDGE